MRSSFFPQARSSEYWSPSLLVKGSFSPADMGPYLSNVTNWIEADFFDAIFISLVGIYRLVAHSACAGLHEWLGVGCSVKAAPHTANSF